MPRCYMVKKWAAKYQAEMNEVWNSDENDPVSGASVEVSSSDTDNIYVEGPGTPINVSVQYFDNSDDAAEEVYIENAATPVAITDHQYYQTIGDGASTNGDGKLDFLYDFVIRSTVRLDGGRHGDDIRSVLVFMD